MPSSTLLADANNKCNIILKMIEKDQYSSIDTLIEKIAKLEKEAEKRRRDIISKTEETPCMSVGEAVGLSVARLATKKLMGSPISKLNVLGAAFFTLHSTGVLSSIFENNFWTSETNQLKELLKNCNHMQCDYNMNVKHLQVILNDSEFSVEWEKLLCERQLDVTKWLKSGHLHEDRQVNPSDLRMGDHIFRVINISPCYHHGIYISHEMVVDAGSDGVSSRPLDTFKENRRIYRRDYMGFALPPDETKKLIMESLGRQHKYNLFTNNCEHFATLMKVQINFSSQVHTPSSAAKNVASNIARIAIAFIINTPISIAFDVTSLVSKFKNTDQPLEMATDLKEYLTEQKDLLKENAIALRELKSKINSRKDSILRLETERESLQQHQIELQRRRVAAQAGLKYIFSSHFLDFRYENWLDLKKWVKLTLRNVRCFLVVNFKTIAMFLLALAILYFTGLLNAALVLMLLLVLALLFIRFLKHLY